MKAIKNWNEVQAQKEFVPLPAGGYVCKIQGAKVKEYSGEGWSFERLEIALDIEEGEYKGYYQQDFENQTGEDKRWRGVLRMRVPTGDGSDQDAWSASRLKAFTNAVEDSNPGYHWEWEESTLKGKLVGILFRSEEWEFNGRSGWKSKPFRAVDVGYIRDGKFRIPKEKPLKNKPVAAAPVDFSSVEIETDGDLPF